MQQLPKLSANAIEILKTTKNLLAFSGGSDSTALFFILKELNIKFDVALVNYQTRKESSLEEEYAKQLAKQNNKECFTLTCKLENNNFEHNARSTRYTFFQEIIDKNAYDVLLTAHHLNDKFEWFLMQLSRGAGAVELSGMNEVEETQNFKTIRPLLHVEKKQIETFLHVNKIKYFLDASNNDKKYFRNQIRNEFSNAFCEKYANGIKKSFDYLQRDTKRLLPKNTQHIKNLYILENNEDDLINIRGIDKIVKKLGTLLSSASREEILRTKDCIVSSKIAVVFSQNKIYICPWIKITMDKKFKEACRVEKIPSKIRPYMYKENISIETIL
ncbi:tRNA lysidine(34) synthetase TilS [Sulfurospirillum arcachonense]|uniref:tRNA lysidine(34) synthetase TilS n=1 Tax=Sulfurospirillum arcachonense TaxID=57666 RepID=UPI0004694FEB|nr:tRNA lysidine(34) synthetase TilS [Sulfurospirillum arcachonense]